jgi:hypothetical protein
LYLAIATALAGCRASQPYAISLKPAPAGPEAPAGANLQAGTGPAPAPAVVTAPESGHHRAAHEAIDLRDPKSWIARNKTSHPDADGFPQIIQGEAYPTIAAIEAWYEAIAGSPKHEPWGEEEPFKGVTTGRGAIVSSRKRSVELVVKSDALAIDSRTYYDETTRDLFSSLSRLLGDLETTFGPARVKGTRYTNSAYRDVAVVEFCYPPLVVALSALSNGANNPERLYVLDLIEQNDSLLWHESTQ